jgi:hypothetical protein
VPLTSIHWNLITQDIFWLKTFDGVSGGHHHFRAVRLCTRTHRHCFVYNKNGVNAFAALSRVIFLIEATTARIAQEVMAC